MLRSGSKTLTHESPGNVQADLALRCHNLSKRFPLAEAVTDAAFELESGEILALVGPSGGGKTTVLRLIAGFESPDQGFVELAGKLVADPQHSEPPETRNVGMVFQDYALFPNMNVWANVAFGVRDKHQRSKRVDEVLALVGLQDEAGRMPSELSGGQQQRVALARALAPRPTVVLLDEPFSNLDATLRTRVRSDIHRILRESNTSAVFVTHDQDEAFSMADRIGIMLNHTVAQIGKPEEVYLNPASLDVARFLGIDNVLSGVSDGRIVQCELGGLKAVNVHPSGDVQVAIRPQAIRVLPADQTSTEAIVISREFHGFHKELGLELASGTILRSVMGIHIPAESGDRVSIEVNGEIAVFQSST